MDNHQHTVLVLVLLILGIRLLATGKLQAVWNAIFAKTSTQSSAPTEANSGAEQQGFSNIVPVGPPLPGGSHG